MTIKIKEHAYKLVRDSLKDYTKYELESLACEIEYELRDRKADKWALELDNTTIITGKVSLDQKDYETNWVHLSEGDYYDSFEIAYKSLIDEDKK